MVFGPGLIVMEADNDAGAVSTTYVEASAVVERYHPCEAVSASFLAVAVEGVK
jgi:hypothetical protein